MNESRQLKLLSKSTYPTASTSCILLQRLYEIALAARIPQCDVGSNAC